MQTVSLDFLKNSCAIALTTRAWGNKRQGNIDKVQTDADKSRLKLTKSLVLSEEYEAVRRHQTETRNWVMGRSNPLPGFKGGLYLAKLDWVKRIDSELPGRVATLRELVAAFCAAYPAKVIEAREQLNGQFREADYPSVDEMPDFFSIEWNWLSFDVAKNLPDELREQEAIKLEAKFKNAGEEILYGLRVGFQELIGYAVNRLTTEPGEKQKIFRDSLIGNVQEFIETFSARNLMNDADLEALVGKAREIITGVSPQGLRDSSKLREKTLAAFSEVKARLDTMITERPSRKFEMD